jgi:hypothetical protein
MPPVDSEWSLAVNRARAHRASLELAPKPVNAAHLFFGIPRFIRHDPATGGIDMSVRKAFVSAAIALVLVPHATQAQTGTGMANMTSLWNAWNQSALAINLDIPEISAGCSTAGVYVTDPANPASKLIEPILLSAYMARRKVGLILQGCYQGSYPTIISVNVEP